jgi:hypothetical protein
MCGKRHALPPQTGIDLNRRSTGFSQPPSQSSLIVIPELGGASGRTTRPIGGSRYGLSRWPLGVDPTFGGVPLEHANQLRGAGLNESEVSCGRVSANAVGWAQNHEHAIGGHPPLQSVDTGSKRTHWNAHRSQDRDAQAETN